LELVLEFEWELEVSTLSSVRKLALERLRKSERNEGAMAGGWSSSRLDGHYSNSREERAGESWRGGGGSNGCRVVVVGVK
jgi:hypothetical protein